MSDERERAGSGGAGAQQSLACGGGVVLLLAAYVLSLGPATAWVHSSGVAWIGAYSTVYRPLLWLVVQGWGRPLEWYVRLWL